MNGRRIRVFAALSSLLVAGVVFVGGAHAAATPTVSAGDVRIWEGDTGTRTALVAVTLDEPAPETTTSVAYTVTPGTASPGTPKAAETGADFKAKTGTLTFHAGAVVKYVAVVVFGDVRDESDESVTVTLSAPSGLAMGDGDATVTIVDDDASPSATSVVSAGDVTVHEGNLKTRVAKVPLTMSQPATGTVSVDYQLVGGTATGGWKGRGVAPDGTDFADKLGAVQTITFKLNGKGLTPVNKVVAVKIATDAVGEQDETWTVALLAINGPAAIGDGAGVGTIIDDDIPASANLAVTLAGSGGGSVSSTPAGISCGSTCSAAFAGGSDVMLSATPDGSSVFSGWSGACSGTGACSVTMNGDESVTATFTPIPPPTVWTQVAAGRNHSCGLTGGAAYCWGFGGDGELGNGTNVGSVDSPVPVSGLGSGVAAITTGDYHSCALTNAGAVWCWGMNTNGQLGDGTTTSRNAPVAVSGLGSGVASVSAGYGHTCAVTDADALLCWGYNSHGELGDTTTTSRSTPVGVFGFGSGAASVSAGNDHTCAVTTGGAARCWGRNVFGELGDGTETASSTPVAVFGLGSGVAKVSAGGLFHSCAVTTLGAVSCWGDNTNGELGDGTMDSSSVPVAVSGLGTGVIDVSTGGFTDGNDYFTYSCAVTSGGDADCWGDNGVGQLGDGSDSSSVTPVLVVAQGTATVAVSSGFDHSCGLTVAGVAFCWGSSSSGKLGDGGNGGGSTPVTVIGP